MSEYNFDEMPESDVVVNNCFNRYKKGLGTNIFVIGMPGTGKSSCCMRLGELIINKKNENTDDEKNEMFITDSLIQFVEAVIKSKIGDVIVVEEAGVLFPSRRAMSRSNVNVGKMFDTVRKKQLILISNAPILGSIDGHMRALGHILIETIKILKKKKVVISKPLRLQTNPKSGKTYFHRFQRNGREVNLTFTRMPNSDTWKAYELNKDKFMAELYQQLLEDTKDEKDKIDRARRKRNGDLPPVTPKEERLIDMIDNKELTHGEVADIMGYVKPETAKRAYDLAKKKLEFQKSEK